jgi:hypothetical protein
MLFCIIRDFIGTPTVPKNPDGSEQIADQERDKFENRSTFVEFINREEHLMMKFFSNFQFYMDKMRAAVRQRVLADSSTVIRELSERVLFDRFAHSDQMNERINFLKYVCKNSNVKITGAQLSIMFNEMVTLSLFNSDTDLFYKFLKDICNLHAQGYPVIQMGELIAFFRT